MILGYRKVELNMIYASIILLTGHLIFGTVYLTMLSCLIQLTYLNLDLVSSGSTHVLYMILKPKFREPEVEVSVS